MAKFSRRVSAGVALIIPTAIAAPLALAQIGAPMDPLDDSRWVEANGGFEGDDTFAETLALEERRRRIIAAPGADEAERLLPSLIAIAGSDDPATATIAMQSVLRIAEELEGWRMQNEHRLLPDGVLSALEALENRDGARGDLAAAAAMARARLQSLSGSENEAAENEAAE